MSTQIGIGCGGCDSDENPSIAAAPKAASNPDGQASSRFVPETFEQLYPIFLMRKLSPGEKASLWNRNYQGKWVRWTGTLVKVTPIGALVRIHPGTITYDLVVRFDDEGGRRLAGYHNNRQITFVAMLDRYDDVLRTMYLSHGDVPPPPADAGADAH